MRLPGRREASAARHPDDRIDAALASLGHRSATTLQDRLRKLRFSALVGVQAGAAAALAWYVAKDLLNNPQPIFAPAVAVGTLASSLGHRLRRTLYLIAGVAVGITVGDLLVVVIGNGHIQIGLIVAVSILLAVMLSGEGGFIAQAGGSAMVIAVLSPASTNLAVPRLVDGVVGGAAGLAVSLLLLPLHPVHRIKRAAGPPLDALARELAVAADALAARDQKMAKQALDRLRAVSLGDLETTLSGAVEVAKVSPVRWHQRTELSGWRHGAGLMMRSLVHSRPLVLRLTAVIEDGEPVPQALVEAVRSLATAVRHVRDGFAPGKPSTTCQRAALNAIRLAHQALGSGLGFSGVNVAGQIKTVAVNTLRATGISKADAERLEQSVGPDSRGRPDTQPVPDS
ncbi:FUSC family protein [Micromonospora sp. NPDC047074]|uniref:FUSC family protein n=1 Tax=Micromonospora sp. NPDC047074 TaxID=3154339 RepID=UPI0033E02274